jgi:phenylpropionate dioxygenase-like ring-hydroxylating dioxygenase large terminal subunit
MTTPRTRIRNPVPREGERGLFSQSWFPICRSEELSVGTVLGREFLDGRVAVYRDPAGEAQVVSAYCAHLGADLSIGSVVDGELQCPFHHWRYGAEGRCTRTGIGDPAPPGAGIFRYPTLERYGVVFAFNGLEPLFPLFELAHDARELVGSVSLMEMQTEPWVFCANVPDFQHFLPIHRTLRDDLGHYERIRWEPFGLSFEFTAFPNLGRGTPIPFQVAVQGTSIIVVQGRLPDGRWFGTFAAMSLPRPGQTEIFIGVNLRRSGATPEAEQADTALLALLVEQFRIMAGEDLELLSTAHYVPGALTRHDQALARYMAMLRSYPRAHPGAAFLR